METARGSSPENGLGFRAFFVAENAGNEKLPAGDREPSGERFTTKLSQINECNMKNYTTDSVKTQDPELQLNTSLHEYSPYDVPALNTLARIPHWVIWRLEPGKNGKPTKIPYSPHSGRNASTTDPATWSDHQTAQAAKDKYQMTGIGFVFTKDEHITGIDFDNCIVDGQVEPWAREDIDRLDSYTEISHSGNGLHVLVYGNIPTGRKKGNIEMYDDTRFFVVTGNRFPDAPVYINNRSTEVNDVYHRYFGSKEKQRESPSVCLGLDDQAVLDLLGKARNRDKFQSLWGGDISAYPSHSEADIALCSLIAFYTQDEKQIDRIFRASGLYREEKWDRNGDSYSSRTIQNALSALTETYTPPIQSSPVLTSQGIQEAQLTTWADIARILGPLEWEWEGWLARGFETLVASISGDGKSTILLRIAASYIRGDPWPDGTPYAGETGKILWCETEAAQALNIDRATKWRLPLEKIINPAGGPLEDIELDNPAHQAAIMDIAHRDDVKAIFVDSLSGGATGRDNKNSSDMLAIGKWLAELARDTNKPLIVAHHLRKKSVFDGDKINLDRLRDSSSIVQTARVVWAIDAPDYEYPEQKRLYVIKSNLGRFPEPVGFEILENKVRFGLAPEPPREDSPMDRAVDLLLSLLQKQPVSYEDIEKEAAGAAISMATMRRAKKKLNIVPRKEGNGGWSWALPARE